MRPRGDLQSPKRRSTEMTVNRLAVALAALMMLLGLSIPALAGARGASGRRIAGERHRLEKRHPRSSSPAGCKLSLNAEPRTLTAGEAPQVFGRLQCPARHGGRPDGDALRPLDRPGQPGGRHDHDRLRRLLHARRAGAEHRHALLRHRRGRDERQQGRQSRPRGDDQRPRRNRGAADGRQEPGDLQRHRQPQ